MLTATAPTTNGFPATVPGTKLLGEVISWTCPGIAVRHADVIAALRDAGLDESVARVLLPRHAFSRACKKLREPHHPPRRRGRRRTSRSSSPTRVGPGDTYEYTLETDAHPPQGDREGGVRHPRPGDARPGTCSTGRSTTGRGRDVTRLIQRLFDRQADLFPSGKPGGVYFVPQAYAAFVDRVQSSSAGSTAAWPAFPSRRARRTATGRSRTPSPTGLARLIAEHREAVAGFGDDTRRDTLDRAAERIRLTRHKLESYSELLAEEKARLERELAQAAAELRARWRCLLPSLRSPCHDPRRQ